MTVGKDDIAYRKQVVNEYKPDVERLIRYLPWLEEKAGTEVSQNYTGSGIGDNSIAFPVYDSTLIGFIKEVQRTKLLDRNYPYIYSRYHIRTVQDELRVIVSADITHMDILKGILFSELWVSTMGSKYSVNHASNRCAVIQALLFHL